LFGSGVELLEACIKKGCRLSDIMIEDEAKSSGLPVSNIMEKMRYNLGVMRKSASSALEKEVMSISGITGGDAKKVNERNLKGGTICGDTVNRAMARALSCSEVNGAMGRIVAAPTAGSCGILPAVVTTVSEIYDSLEEDIIKCLFAASAIGIVIAKNATLSGAEGGCQAECGSASAMAAAAAVELAGGTPEMCFHAAAIAIKCVLGLICDPVAGLVEVPCAKRNAMGAVNAMAAADMALSGIKSIIPFDEVVEAMYRVGRAIPCEFRETAMGGLASTPSAKKLSQDIFG
jgi:L-serine dehydratase